MGGDGGEDEWISLPPYDRCVCMNRDGVEIWNSYLTKYVMSGVKKRRRGISCLQKTDKIIPIPMRCYGTSKGNWFRGNILWNMQCTAHKNQITESPSRDRIDSGLWCFPVKHMLAATGISRTSSRATILFTSAQLNSFSSPSRRRRKCVEGCMLVVYQKRLCLANDEDEQLYTSSPLRFQPWSRYTETTVYPHHPHIVCSLIHSLRWILIDISCKW